VRRFQQAQIIQRVGTAGEIKPCSPTKYRAEQQHEALQAAAESTTCRRSFQGVNSDRQSVFLDLNAALVTCNVAKFQRSLDQHTQGKDANRIAPRKNE
jgi:hypothetical protein